MTRQRVFYGWWVTIAFAVMVFLSTGVRFSVGPFLKPIVTDLGTDHATYSLIVSRSLFLYWAFTCGFSMSLLSAHGVLMLTEHGCHAMLASSAIGVLAASRFAGTMVRGAIADRFGRRPVLAGLYGTRALLFLAMFLVHDSPPWRSSSSPPSGARACPAASP